jgi:uncharacterized membrane protein YcaP (DUF421 family)
MLNFEWRQLGEIALRTLVIYVFIIAALRITGKRQIGQLTPFDLAVLLLISNAVQNAMTGSDSSLTGGIAAAATLLIANAIVARIRMNSPKFRSVLEGDPVLLVKDGKALKESLKSENLTEDELMISLRQHEVNDIKQVKQAMLEIDGSISVIRLDSATGLLHHSRHRLTRHARRPND